MCTTCCRTRRVPGGRSSCSWRSGMVWMITRRRREGFIGLDLNSAGPAAVAAGPASPGADGRHVPCADAGPESDRGPKPPVQVHSVELMGPVGGPLTSEREAQSDSVAIAESRGQFAVGVIEGKDAVTNPSAKAQSAALGTGLISGTDRDSGSKGESPFQRQPAYVPSRKRWRPSATRRTRASMDGRSIG